jgi:hypothetical protein
MNEKNISNLARGLAIGVVSAIVVAKPDNYSTIDLIAVCTATVLIIYSAGYLFKIIELYREINDKKGSLYQRMQELDRQADDLASYHPTVANMINNSPELKKIKSHLKNSGRS